MVVKRGFLNPIASCLFGPIQRLVSLREELLQFGRAAFSDQQADAQSSSHGTALDLRRRLVERGANSVRHVERQFRSGIVQDGGELLTSETADAISGAKIAAGALGEDLQYAVANRMTVTVIDAFKIVQVDHQDSQRPRLR